MNIESCRARRAVGATNHAVFAVRTSLHLHHLSIYSNILQLSSYSLYFDAWLSDIIWLLVLRNITVKLGVCGPWPKCPTSRTTVPSRTIVRTVSSELLVCSFSLFFVSVQCARLSWLSRQLLSTRKYTVSYHIVSYWYQIPYSEYYGVLLRNVPFYLQCIFWVRQSWKGGLIFRHIRVNWDKKVGNHYVAHL